MDSTALRPKDKVLRELSRALDTRTDLLDHFYTGEAHSSAEKTAANASYLHALNEAIRDIRFEIRCIDKGEQRKKEEEELNPETNSLL